MPADPRKAPVGFSKRLKYERRKRVKDFGKLARPWLRGFAGRQSPVDATPVLASRDFPFPQQFTDHRETIRGEVVGILKLGADIALFQEVPSDQSRIAKGGNRRAFALFGFGAKLEKNRRQAPGAAALPENLPNLQSARFPILAPGCRIARQKGGAKGILRTHPGLLIPRDAERCRPRAAPGICVWREGGIFVFDDTCKHEAGNKTPDERVILIFDVDRPMRFRGRRLDNLFVIPSLAERDSYRPATPPPRPLSEAEAHDEELRGPVEAAAPRANANLEKPSNPES